MAQINKNVQIIFNNFLSTILTRSVFTCIEELSSFSEPIITLFMKVDRQSLKLDET